MIKSDDNITIQFTLRNSSGGRQDADSLPSGTLVQDGSDLGTTVNVANVSTGVYTAGFTVPSSLPDYTRIQLRITATVDTITEEGIIFDDYVLDGQSVSELQQGAIDDIWGNSTRTLTQSAASVAAAVNGDQITVVRGTTWDISLTGLGNLTNYDSIFFSVKRRFDDDDDSALLRVRDNVTGGLERFNGVSPSDSDNGTITIDDSSAGDITITVEAAETQNSPLVSDFYYDIKAIDDDGQVNILSRGLKSFDIVGDVTNKITS